MNIFFDDHRNLLKLMVKCGVRFLLIGGYAVIYYGYERSTGDMDVWLEISEQNKDSFIAALSDFGITNDGIAYVQAIDFTKPFPTFFFGKTPERIDFISLVQRVTFEEAYPQANHFLLDGASIPIIQYHHLLLTKKFTGRLKDQADVEELERIHKYRNNEQ